MSARNSRTGQLRSALWRTQSPSGSRSLAAGIPRCAPGGVAGSALDGPCGSAGWSGIVGAYPQARWIPPLKSPMPECHKPERACSSELAPRNAKACQWGYIGMEIVDVPIGLTATGTRREFDSLGDVQVPADQYWGAQTQRSLQHFNI